MMGFVIAFLLGIAVCIANGGGVILFVPLFLYYYQLSMSESLYHTAVVIFFLSVFVVLNNLSEFKNFIPRVVHLVIPILTGFICSRILLSFLPVSFSGIFSITLDMILYLVISAILIYSGINMVLKTRLHKFINYQSQATLLFTEGFIPAGGLVFCPRSEMVLQMKKISATVFVFTLLGIKSTVTVVSDLKSVYAIDWKMFAGILAAAMSGFAVARFYSSIINATVVKQYLGIVLLFCGLSIAAFDIIK